MWRGMYKCYESTNALEAHVVATYLGDHGIPVNLFDEASFIVGYGPAAGTMKLMVPDSFKEKADAVVAERRVAEPLPEDAEFVFEGEAPPALSGWEFAVSPLQLVRQIAIVVLALQLFGGVVFLAMLLDIGIAAG